MGILRITNEKCARNVERTINTSDMALLLLLIELVESFTIIVILYTLIHCEFPLTHSSLAHTHGICITLSNLCTRLPFVIL